MYRDEEQVTGWLAKDPLTRLEKYLAGRGLLSDGQREQLAAGALEEAKEAFERAEKEADPCLEDTFRYTFASLPPVLERQLERRRSS